MPTFPLPQGSLAFGQTFATTTYGTTLTAGSSNAKGTPVELIASTAHDAHWVEFMASNPSAGASFAIDLLIGSATEAVLVPNMTFRGFAANDGGARWLFPVFVPKGSRIAAQVGSSTNSATCIVGVVLFNSGIACNGMPQAVRQYGTLTNSLGVNIDPGGSANTKAGLTQITAATDFDHHWLVLTIANTDTAIGANTKWLIDVLIGSSTEANLVANLLCGAGNTIDVLFPETVYHLPVYVPKGSRLSVQAQCNSTVDGDRDLYVTLHGC